MPKHRDPKPDVPNPKYPPTPNYQPKHPAPLRPLPTPKPKPR